MIDIDSLDKFGHEYLILIKKLAKGKLEKEDLYLAEDYSLIDSIQKDIKNMNLSIELFIKAKNSNDELAMRAALLQIRVFMMGVYGVFYQTVEDIDRFFELSGDITFPEDYKVPGHYNYPLK